jgi:hypothetical protein
LPAGHPVAIVEVADAGPGMSPAEARHAFERLYRADPNRAGHEGGTGLGLAIVAAIVQAHGGRVELYTTVGAGARFRVLLPTGQPAGDRSGQSVELLPQLRFSPERRRIHLGRDRGSPRTRSRGMNSA